MCATQKWPDFADYGTFWPKYGIVQPKYGAQRIRFHIQFPNKDMEQTAMKVLPSGPGGRMMSE